MLSLKDIEEAVSNLKEKELRKFRAWFEEFDAMTWDKQFAENVKSGRVDKIAEKALEDYKKGKCKELWSILPDLLSGNVMKNCLQK